MKSIKHPLCGKLAFYVPNFPVGREILPIDALDKNGIMLAMGNRIECLSCKERVDLEKVNEYYEVEVKA